MDTKSKSYPQTSKKKGQLSVKCSPSYTRRNMDSKPVTLLYSPPLDLATIKRRGAGYAKSPKIRKNFSSKGTFFVPEKVKRSYSVSSIPSSLLLKEGVSPSSLLVKDLLQDEGDSWLPIRFVKEGDHLASIVESLSTWRRSITAVHNEEGKITGVIDVMDLLQICYQRIKSSPNYECSSLECRESFLLEDAKSFLEKGFGSKIVSLSFNAPLSDLISLLAFPQTKNVVILKEGVVEAHTCEDLAAILTHTDLIRYALKYPHLFPRLQTKVSECISFIQGEKELKEEVENRVREEFLVASSFKTIWNKQSLGGVYCHGHSFLDKFMNWLVQILMADLPVEEITLEPSSTLLELVKLMFQMSVSRVLIVDDQQQTLGFADVRNSIGKLKESSSSFVGKLRDSLPSPQPAERSL